VFIVFTLLLLWSEHGVEEMSTVTYNKTWLVSTSMRGGVVRWSFFWPAVAMRGGDEAVRPTSSRWRD
jgi:hypothetical protein